jgi:hypothetical protein
MGLRPVIETVASLRGMLRESQENLAPRDGQSVAAELEDILRQRIEDLEPGGLDPAKTEARM